MRILYLGDIVGEITLKCLKENLNTLKNDLKCNMVFVNAENLTQGKGLIYKHYKALKELGISAISMGNHTFSKKEIKDYINNEDVTIVRPANLNTEYGKEILYAKYNDKTIALVNMLGRVYSNTPLDCPFKTMERLLKEIKADYIFVDFHGDATSEKKAFFYEFAGRVDAIVGSHTHVQTSDEETYNKTSYITDMGMCGPHLSVIGDDKDMVIKRFKTGVFEPLFVSTDNTIDINGVVIDINGEVRKIERISKKYKINVD